MKKQTYDIIGDIHGHYHKLVQLLDALGYLKNDNGYYHPEGHKAAFLGDFIDPKYDNDPNLPHDVPAVLETVKAMVDNNNAVAVMGNHEFNAIAHATPNGINKGKYLRSHKANKNLGLKRSINAFNGGFDGVEWQNWIQWFKDLPLFLELDGLRLVHAYWNQDAVNAIGNRKLSDHDFLHKAANKGNPEHLWVDNLLKGYEIPMPIGHTFIDHTGIERNKFRARWFDQEPKGKLASDLLFPAGNYNIPAAPLPPETTALIPGYHKKAAPVFFGHYFKPENAPLEPELHNLACLDYSVAKGGPMVAYRWNGEQILNPDNYIAL